jgi:hypothetical protein
MTQTSSTIPSGKTTPAGYPSRAVPSTAGSSLSTLMMASKNRNAMTRPLTTRPAQRAGFETGAAYVADMTTSPLPGSPPPYLVLSRTSSRGADQGYGSISIRAGSATRGPIALTQMNSQRGPKRTRS